MLALPADAERRLAVLRSKQPLTGLRDQVDPLGTEHPVQRRVDVGAGHVGEPAAEIGQPHELGRLLSELTIGGQYAGLDLGRLKRDGLVLGRLLMAGREEVREAECAL